MRTVTSEVTSTSSTELLARVHLTAVDRRRAEIALLRGEALAELLLGATRIVKGWLEHQPQHANNPQQLKSAG